jgi:hypothetical protein
VRRADWLRRADRRRAGHKFRDGVESERKKDSGREARGEEEQQLCTRRLDINLLKRAVGRFVG